MKRPVWLLSMDTDQFCAPPLTTGALQAYFERHGRTAPGTQVALVHFPHADDVLAWLRGDWRARVRPEAEAAVAAAKYPVTSTITDEPQAEVYRSTAPSAPSWTIAELARVSPARTLRLETPPHGVAAGQTAAHPSATARSIVTVNAAAIAPAGTPALPVTGIRMVHGSSLV